MRIPRITSLCILLLALVACRESEFEPVVAAEEGVEPLPAPLPVAGAVTAIAGAAGPGAMPAANAATSINPMAPAALPVIAPVPGEDPSGDPASTGGHVAAIAFADGGLPPLEDNPETGLGAQGETPAPAAPAPAAQFPEAPMPAASVTLATAPVDPAPSGEREAVAAVNAYYDALRRGDVGRAYAAWSDGGRASGRTPEQFAAGADGVAIASVSVGKPGRVEGAAGGRYVEVPVTVTSRGRDGRDVRQVGTFVMRTSQVDGAARGWHIASAELRELQP
jgi:hypothetical protein